MPRMSRPEVLRRLLSAGNFSALLCRDCMWLSVATLDVQGALARNMWAFRTRLCGPPRSWTRWQSVALLSSQDICSGVISRLLRLTNHAYQPQ